MRRFRCTVVSFFKNAEEKDCSQSWALLPGIVTYPSWLQAMLYTVVLLYIFLGIAIISDIFMNSVEAITSHETTIAVKDTLGCPSKEGETSPTRKSNGHFDDSSSEEDDRDDNFITVKIWNPTVANLTLLALGSSAPEILLAIYETTVTLGDTPGELGPSTIVGSASFNLFVITAICILTIPSDSVKKISKFGVFVLTSIVSVAVYIWMLIVLDVNSPGVVTITEAVITVLGFPLLVAAAYLQDIGVFDRILRKYLFNASPDDSVDNTTNDVSSGSIESINGGNNDQDGHSLDTTQEKNSPIKPQFSQKIDEAEFKTLAGKLLPSDDERQEMEGIREMLSILKHSKILDKNGKLSNLTNQIITRVTDTKKGINFHKRNAKRSVLGKGSLVKDERDKNRPEQQRHFNGETSSDAVLIAQGSSCIDSKSLSSSSCSSSVVLDVKDHPKRKMVDKHSSRDCEKDLNNCVLSFTSSMYNVYESSDSVLVVVTRKGMIDRNVRIAVDYVTYTASESNETEGKSKSDKSEGGDRRAEAEAGTNYIGASGTLIFDRQISHISIPITICNTHMSDDSQSSIQNALAFQVKLQNARHLESGSSPNNVLCSSHTVGERTHQDSCSSSTDYSSSTLSAPHQYDHNGNNVQVTFGEHRICSVTIISDDWKTHPGILDFDSRTITINESRGWVEITVLRTMGARGEVCLDYNTSNGSAVDGVDYHSTEGSLVFQDGEKEKSFFVQIIDDIIPELDVEFYVHLSNARGGASIGTKNVAIVKIIDDDTIDRLRDEIKRQLETRLDFIELGTQSWRKQFLDAMRLPVNVNEADGSEIPPSLYDAIVHFMTFNWKVLFAIVPPTSIGYGFPAFFVSLLLIGILTALVGEYAELFGCSIGMKPPITAISFVALGTSLPDAFASYLAARDGDDADAAIGNIMGSNSVNVFLGLGIPWLMGSVYYYFNDKDTNGKYCVPTSSLVYSVMIFSVFAFSAFILLLLRRRSLGGELGGERNFKIVSFVFLFTLWISYIVLSALKTEGHIAFGEDKIYDKFGCAVN